MAKGENGTGKSIALASFALLGPVYFAFAEPRFRSLLTYYGRYLPRVRPDLKEDCDKIVANISYDYFPTYSPLEEKLRNLKDYCPYRFVFVESMTSICEHSIQQTFDLKPNKGKKVGQIRVTDVEHYSAEFSGLMDLLYLTLQIQAHVFWTGHVITYDQPRLNAPAIVHRTLVARGKKVGPTMAGYFDEYWHFQVDTDGTYVMITKPEGEDAAKTSLDLPQRITWGNDIFARRLFDYYPERFWPQVTKEMMPSVELTDEHGAVISSSEY